MGVHHICLHVKVQYKDKKNIPPKTQNADQKKKVKTLKYMCIKSLICSDFPCQLQRGFYEPNCLSWPPIFCQPFSTVLPTIQSLNIFSPCLSVCLSLSLSLTVSLSLITLLGDIVQIQFLQVQSAPSHNDQVIKRSSNYAHQCLYSHKTYKLIFFSSICQMFPDHSW